MTTRVGTPRAGHALRVLAAVLLLAAAAPLSAAPDGRPRVRLIATGGTIANGRSARLDPEQLLAMVPRIERLARVEAEAFANVSSTELSLEDWVRLSQRVARGLATDPGLAGIIVTSGTDTLEELAWFLHLTVPGDRPVVVVGAMRRPGAPDADGPSNLADAIRVATAPGTRGLGTLVVMNHQVLAARTVAKRHARRLDAFDADEESRLGEVRRGRVRLDRRTTGRLAAGSLALEPGAALPRVDVLVTAQGSTGDLIDAAVAAGARGIVLAGAGAGSLTPGEIASVHRIARGVPVVLGTRTGDGAVTRSDRPNSLGLIPAGDLQPLKARILLMLALARHADQETIERLFEAAATAQ